MDGVKRFLLDYFIGDNDIFHIARATITAVENGYTQLQDVTTKERWDTLESFFFAPKGTFSFEDYVLNTEAHPLKNSWDKGWKGNRVGLK